MGCVGWEIVADIAKMGYIKYNRMKGMEESAVMKNHVAVLTKPVNRMTVISEQESRKFIYEFNKNKVTAEFLNSCKKAGKLFNKDDFGGGTVTCTGKIQES